MVIRVPFPPVNSGGPIEARRGVRRTTTGGAVFPPVNSGGPIEAIERAYLEAPDPSVSAGEFRRPH